MLKEKNEMNEYVQALKSASRLRINRVIPATKL